MLDLTMTMGAKAGISGDSLCTKCNKLPFRAHFKTTNEIKVSSDNPNDEKGVPPQFAWTLEHVLQNRNWCKFCRIVFWSLCKEENDPLLTNPEIQDHVQDKWKKWSFSRWAENTDMFGRKFTHERDWPFGHSHAPTEARDHAQQALNNTGRHQSSSRPSKGLPYVDAAMFSKITPWSTPLERNPLKPRILLDKRVVYTGSEVHCRLA